MAWPRCGAPPSTSQSCCKPVAAVQVDGVRRHLAECPRLGLLGKNIKTWFPNIWKSGAESGGNPVLSGGYLPPKNEATCRRCQFRVGRTPVSAHRFLHERADPCFFGGSQLFQREGGRPHGAFVEVRLVQEAERRVPRFELRRALEEADDLAVPGIRGHPIPESRRESWRAGFDDRMEPLAQGAIRSRHRGDRREHGTFPVRLVPGRAGARGCLLRGLLGGAPGASGTFSHFSFLFVRCI